MQASKAMPVAAASSRDISVMTATQARTRKPSTATTATTTDRNAPAKQGVIMPTKSQATAVSPVKSRISGTSPTKAQRAETTKALTKAQQTALTTLVQAVKDGVTKFQTADRDADSLRVVADTIKVHVARAVGKLADHPATVGTRGPKAGAPALTKIATLTGYAPSTLEPIFKAGMELRKLGWHKRTAEPNAQELAIVRGHVASENDRKYANTKANKAKAGTKPGTKGTKSTGAPTFETLAGQAKALAESVERFTKGNGFTNAQADELATALDAIHDMIERATAK